jgi:hypothetical protein
MNLAFSSSLIHRRANRHVQVLVRFLHHPPSSQPELVEIPPPKIIGEMAIGESSISNSMSSQLQYVADQRASGRKYYQPTWMTHENLIQENMTTKQKVKKLSGCSNLLKSQYLREEYRPRRRPLH